MANRRYPDQQALRFPDQAVERFDAIANELSIKRVDVIRAMTLPVVGLRNPVLDQVSRLVRETAERMFGAAA